MDGEVVATYNDFEVDDMFADVFSVGERDEVGHDAHDNHGRDPDEDVTDHEEGREPGHAVVGSVHHGNLWDRVTWCCVCVGFGLKTGSLVCERAGEGGKICSCFVES